MAAPITIVISGQAAPESIPKDPDELASTMDSSASVLSTSYNVAITTQTAMTPTAWQWLLHLQRCFHLLLLLSKQRFFDWCCWKLSSWHMWICPMQSSTHQLCTYSSDSLDTVLSHLHWIHHQALLKCPYCAVDYYDGANFQAHKCSMHNSNFK